VCDLLKKEELTFATLKYEDFRILKVNETYYQQYDNVNDKNLKVDYSYPIFYEYS